MAKKESFSSKCSFCGRQKEDVNLLIAGISGHICDLCIEQAYAIIKEELHLQKPFDPGDATLKTPAEIKKFLDQYIIDQDEAKKVLAVAVYNHYKRLSQNNADDDSKLKNQISSW
jgi:ATP-dependent Clp protease ATP-binding subunit ClpX